MRVYDEMLHLHDTTIRVTITHTLALVVTTERNVPRKNCSRIIYSLGKKGLEETCDRATTTHSKSKYQRTNIMLKN